MKQIVFGIQNKDFPESCSFLGVSVCIFLYIQNLYSLIKMVICPPFYHVRGLFVAPTFPNDSTAGSLFKGIMGTSIASMPSTPRDRSTKHVAQTVLEVLLTRLAFDGGSGV